MKIVVNQKVENESSCNILFLRVDPEDISLTIGEILNSLSNLSWIAKFDSDYLRMSYTKRARDSATYLATKIQAKCEDQITADTGEYVVSELARKAIVTGLNYLDVPLAELFKEQVSGNPGFDFYSANADQVIIFGEAKYSARDNAYGVGLKQVCRFALEGQDISDLPDIDKFFTTSSLEAVGRGEKAYAVAFSAKATSSEKLIQGILRNKQCQELMKYNELVFVAVNI